VISFLPVSPCGNIAPADSSRSRHEVALQGVRALFPETQQSTKRKSAASAQKKEEDLKSYFTKLRFIAPSCAKLVPAN